MTATIPPAVALPLIQNRAERLTADMLASRSLEVNEWAAAVQGIATDLGEVTAAEPADRAAPAFRLADITTTGQINPAMQAVEEILQLRHDIDDHQLAVTLLRGYRTDLTVDQVEWWIDELITRADNVYAAARATDGERQFALDYYENGLATFLGGRR